MPKQVVQPERPAAGGSRLRRLTLLLLIPALLGVWWADGYAHGELCLGLALLARAYWLERKRP
jgi:hypothetical protein